MADIHPIRQYRAAHQISREALGKELEVTGTAIYRWERGTRSIRQKLLPKIKEKTGIEPEEIMAFEARKIMEPTP